MRCVNLQGTPSILPRNLLYYKAMCCFIQYIVLYASFCAP